MIRLIQNSHLHGSSRVVSDLSILPFNSHISENMYPISVENAGKSQENKLGELNRIFEMLAGGISLNRKSLEQVGIEKYLALGGTDKLTE